MSIQVKKVSKSYDGTPVLEEINLSINQGTRVALVGENGAGKTTLLRLLSGDIEPTQGKILKDDFTETIHVSQEFPQEYLDLDCTAEDYVSEAGGSRLRRSVLRILNDFDLDESFLSQRLRNLSGGQKKILNVAVAFARKPNYLFLDEPENHIDIFGRQILIEMMQSFRGCLVFVSHDQDLINAVANQIIEVEDGKLSTYTGTYEFYLSEKQRKEEAKKKAFAHYEREHDRLDKLIKRMREWVKKNPDLGAMLRAKKTQLQRLTTNAPPKPKQSHAMKLGSKDVEQKRGKMIITAEGLSLGYGTETLIEKTDMYLRFGEKVSFVGRNGTGKSTFIKAVLGKIEPQKGTLRIGNDITIGYFSQDHQEELQMNKSPLDVLGDVLPGQESRLRSILAKFLIDKEICMRPIKTLSGGQKTRLRFCLLFSRQNDLLLLDEPTNHLDPVSWDVLVQAIQDYNGTVLMVSHDRVFIDQVATKLWTIEDKQVNEYLGTLTEYLSE